MNKHELKNKLISSADGWNKYRTQNPHFIPYLKGANLTGADLTDADLKGAKAFEPQKKDFVKAGVHHDMIERMIWI